MTIEIASRDSCNSRDITSTADLDSFLGRKKLEIKINLLINQFNLIRALK